MRKCKQRLSAFLVQIDTDTRVAYRSQRCVSVANLSRLYTMDYSNLKTGAKKGKIRGRKYLSLFLSIHASLLSPTSCIRMKISAFIFETFLGKKEIIARK